MPAKSARTSCSVAPSGSRTAARNQRGRTPITATSLAFTTTASQPLSTPVRVIGSVAATSTPRSTATAQASSPTAGPTRTSGGAGPNSPSSSARRSTGSFPGFRRTGAMGLHCRAPRAHARTSALRPTAPSRTLGRRGFRRPPFHDRLSGPSAVGLGRRASRPDPHRVASSASSRGSSARTCPPSTGPAPRDQGRRSHAIRPLVPLPRSRRLGGCSLALPSDPSELRHRVRV